MTRRSFALALGGLLLGAASAAAQSGGEPELGYLYPAGGRQGTIVRVLVGGQNMRGLQGVRVTGDGVTATVVRYMGRFVRLNGEERRALWERVRALKPVGGDDRAAGGRDGDRARRNPGGKRAGEAAPGKEKDGAGDDAEKEKAVRDLALQKLDKHPLLGVLDELTPEELEFVERKFLRNDNREQPNAQIGETAMVEVVIAADAPPGDRELRILCPRGISNPMCFQVGTLPEVRETAPADPRAADAEPVDAPVVLNGQITPGDADLFCVRARKGQTLVVQAFARHLLPFLADAVPGWFQAVLTIRDDRGDEVAYADDFRFDPDPVLCFEVPETGVYKVEIRDAIHRGRDDFVYRVSVSEKPFIKSLFPLGGRIDGETVASLDGWNLDADRLPLDTRPGPAGIRAATLHRDGAVSNPVAYAVDALPEVLEAEPNDTPGEARALTLPSIVNGRIGKPGDVDRFRFEGRAGDRVVAEVTARRLRSPLDSLLRLTDASGRVLAWNDDVVDKRGHLHLGMGVQTHYADSRLEAVLPADGLYGIEVSDTRGEGSAAHAYRLRVGPPAGDFALCVTPSGLSLQPGRAAVIHVHALRRDGFDGEIALRFADAPPGFALQGDVIPAGAGGVRLTVTAPARRFDGPVPLRLEGVARIDGREVRREAAPCDDRMQAFLWRHLVPAQELVALVSGRGPRGPVERVGEGPVRIPLGGSVKVLVKIPAIPNPEEIDLELSDPPAGVALADVKVLPDRVLLTLEAGAPAGLGSAGNLIVHVYWERKPKDEKGKKQQARRIWIGSLPAVPFRVVEADVPGTGEEGQ